MRFEGAKNKSVGKRARSIEWYRTLWDRCRAIDRAGFGEIGQAVLEACAELNITRPTVFRYLKRYRENPQFANLSPRLAMMKNPRKRRVSQEALDLLEASINQDYLTRDRKSAAKVYKLYLLKCARAGVEPVSKTTLRCRILAIPESEIARRRDPKELRSRKYRLNHEVTPIAFAPLEVVQMDHRLLDIEAVDSETRMPCGRPWVTGIVDHYSGAVLGFYVTLDAPSSVSVARALLHAASPKDEWMKQTGAPGTWEMYGVPSTVYTDNGSDFHSEAIRDGYRRLGINPPMFRPGGQPNYGGVIERALLTLGLILKGEGGDTGNSPEDRGDRKPEKTANLTLSEIEFLLTEYITIEHHPHRHGKLSSPKLLWKKALRLGTFDTMPLSGQALRELYISFLPTIVRQIGQKGVRVGNLYYSDQLLNKFMSTGQFEQEFHYDPKDARFIYFKDPDDQLFHEIPCENRNLGPISFKDYNAGLKAIHAESDELIDMEEEFRARELVERVLQQARDATTSKKRNREREKRLRTQRPQIVETYSPRTTASVEPRPLEDFEEEEFGEIGTFDFKVSPIGN